MTGPASGGRPPFSGAQRLADDTRRRFLAAIVARVPLERLVEVHLFPPIRQGGVETGVAVVAALPEETGAAEADTPAETAESDAAGVAAEACDPTDDAAVAPTSEDGVPADEAPNEAAPLEASPVADVPVAVEPVADASDTLRVEAAAHELGGPYDTTRASDALEEDDVLPPTPARARHTVFTGRYRLTLKGPDRGKWDADVVESAVAPLVTVEAVVRGVQRRAGDTADPDRLGPDLVARILGPAPNAP
ncbi:hypothetical protein J421_2827 [Gemmatirosa kalamazoonensis]|uniref:Uncharacterized protein n=1 Tax=Gemmatirosa kalamazoonensis TaxID=861299 RepID=W0RGY3_9BACT|nr:hypothetical protein [Gemmatirosa kalamazoonensis]AHG90364.1 hypothetical protein J421_2827 [Gemmatirosa kalamazoonensis]